MTCKEILRSPFWMWLALGLILIFIHQEVLASRGIVVQTQEGQEVKFYRGSYALLIGVSDYTQGWPDLNSVPDELSKVKTVLNKRGFRVRTVLDPDSLSLRNAFNKFINDYGFDKENRLLFFYSGHGHTRDQGRKGYLVPKDAPDPREDEKGFLRKALTMDQILAWSRRIESKHALFLFDSCFSGSVFKAKDLPSTPPDISRATSLSVRQYITAGDAGETVPATSTFTPAFVDALQYAWGDLNKDSYISATELGLYLQKKVPQHSRQSPQYGKIRDYGLSRGDFIFLAVGGGPPPTPSPETGSLLVWTEPEGASVYVSDTLQGQAPVKVSGLKADTYRVEAHKDGFITESRTVRVPGGETTEITLRLPPVKEVGRLYVHHTPKDARVRIMNIVPPYEDGIELKPGAYHIRVDNSGYETEDRQVVLTAGQKLELEIELPEISFKTWTEPETGMEFVWVHGGCYMMGCGSWTDDCYSDEKPAHEVCLDGFWMGKYEVTQGQWQKIMGSNPSRFDRGSYYPVERVSWNDCQDYIKKLNMRSSNHNEFRLPTEAEWEYAARSGGKWEKYAGGSNVDRVAWYGGNSGGRTHRVGTKSANSLGLYDMSGNVWEWCQDVYDSDAYSRHLRTKPVVTSGGSNRVGRGGSWSNGPRHVRAANRPGGNPDHTNRYLGFRLCLPQVR